MRLSSIRIAAGRRPFIQPRSGASSQPTALVVGNGSPDHDRKPRSGDTLTPQFVLIVFQPVFVQERQKLFLKRHTSMMLFLILDVCTDRFKVRFTDGECSISSLPGKGCALRPSLVNPAR